MSPIHIPIDIKKSAARDDSVSLRYIIIMLMTAAKVQYTHCRNRPKTAIRDAVIQPTVSGASRRQ